MCKYLTFCWRPYKGCSNDEQVVRTYKVPPEMKWCPRCSKNDPDKMITWLKYVCTELYKENEKVALSLGFTTTLSPFRDNLDELNGLYGSLARFNIYLHKKVAENLLDEKIEIIAPFLTSSKKKAIKKKINGMSKVSAIKNAVAAVLGDGYIITVARPKNTIITIEMAKATEECQVCFAAPVTDDPRCKTCKNCYTCKECESESLTKYKRCAFCNTDF